ncbi:MAG: hypothetical protein INR71_03940 [Terriglobus roseus]|nr:hypothetical protein [Terriglobus roseus]
MASIARPALLRQCRNAAAGSPVASAFASRAPLARSAVRPQFVRDALPGAARVAAFHATGRKDILPPLPRA